MTTFFYNTGSKVLSHSESRFGFFTRRKLEAQIIYSQDKKKPHFLMAYKIFMESVARNDEATLKKLCEKSFFNLVKQQLADIKLSGQTVNLVQPSSTRMGCWLLDVRTV